MIKKLQSKIILLLCVMMAAAIYFLMSDSEKTKYFNWFQGHTTDSTAIISVYDFGKKCSKSDFKFHSLNCDSVESTYLGNQLYINKIYLKWSSRNDVKIEYKNSQNEMHSLTLKLSKDSLKIIVGSCIYQFQGLKKIWMPGNGWDIFKAMLQEDADMMLWLGDNVYYRNKDFKSKEAKAIKNLYVRNMIAQDFFKSTLHYSIWDDHDYGENNAGNANPQLLKGSLYCKQSFGSISITNGSLQMNIHNNKGEKVIIKEIAFN